MDRLDNFSVTFSEIIQNMTHKIEILGLTVRHYINFVADIKE
jgi:hypothetical protein